VFDKKISVDFMHKHEKKDELFLWPKEADKKSVSKTAVLFKLNQPPKPVDRQHFLIPEHESVTSQIKVSF